jgi:LysR family transcriptional regulator, glycine cleavage system transcriptional activator
MTHRVPPLTSVRAFEAAARHMSFTKAAEELGMTQAAVSYQIKLLEERVGAPLFLRRPRQVTLTEVGRRLAPQVSQAFETLSAAFAETRAGAGDTLSITTVATFASNWLAPRIGTFQVAHPRLAVRLDTSSHLVDFAREEMDVAIRVGRGQWPGLVSHYLMPLTFAPMLSPQLAASIGGVKEPADLLKLPIIGPGDPWWGAWLVAVGLAPASVEGRPKNLLGSQANEAQAAFAGQGVAMLTPEFFGPELTSGRLIQPFDLLGQDQDCFWLAYPESRRNAPKIVAFRAWILAEMERAKGKAAAG